VVGNRSSWRNMMRNFRLSVRIRDFLKSSDYSVKFVILLNKVFLSVKKTCGYEARFGLNSIVLRQVGC
jgi:hypothetical protein